MDPEERRDVAPAQLLRDHAVREQHHLLHQLPGGVAADRGDVKRALLVHVDLRLGEVEVERAGADAHRPKLLREVQQHLDVALELALAVRQPAAFGELLHLAVRQPSVRADDRLLELEGLDLARPRDVDERRQRQPRLALDQRADAVRELLGQHRQHVPWQVHAGGALHGLLVEAGAFGDVVTDVGDVYAHAQQAVLGVAVQALHGEGVVEVLGVFAVDGEGRDVAVVGAALHHLGRHRVGHGLRFGHGVAVELRLQAVLDDDCARLDLRVVAGAEELLDLTERLLLTRLLGPHHAHDDARTALELPDRLRREQDAVLKTHRVGPKDGVPARVLERADDMLVPTRDDPHDLAAGAPVLTLHRVRSRHHAVAVPGARQPVGRDEEVLPAGVRDDEAVPARRDLQSAKHEVHLLRQAVGAAPGAYQAAVVDQAGQHVPQRGAIVDLELSLDVLHVPGALRVICEEAQDLVAIDICHRSKCSPSLPRRESGRRARR